MTRLIKKIDRVKSIDEAIMMEQLGANIIGVSLANNLKFDDDRIITEEVVLAIKKVLKKAKLVGEIIISNDLSNMIKLIKKIGLDYIQPIGSNLPSLEFREALLKEGIGIIYSNIEVSHDDDSSWILSRFLDENKLNASFFQIDLLPEYDNSWEFFKFESPQYLEEIQIEDINLLGNQYPLLIVLDYTPDNVKDILIRMDSIKGITMEMGNNPTRNDFHYFECSEVVKILEELKKLV